MSMASVWFAPATWPFGSALALMIALLALEGLGLLMANSPSDWIDGLFPEPPDGADGIDGPMGWLHLGRVPFLMLLALFLAGFSLAGYLTQALVHGAMGSYLPTWLACIPAALAGVSTVSGLGGALAKLLPREETSAVSEQSLLGRAGVVVQGIAKRGMAAQAKVRDLHGRAHYVMVEPDMDGEEFAEGATVLLVKKQGARFSCIRNPHPELL